MTEPVLRRLHPEPGRLTAVEAAAALELTARALPDRPYVVANMVVTADGKATVRGRSGPIGGDADHALFHALRGEVDAVMAGTRTLEVERYGRLVRDPAARTERGRRGLRPDPLAVTVTASGRLPVDIPLFADSDSTIMVFAGVPLEPPTTAARVVVEPLENLRGALRVLREQHDVRCVLCEGGPTLLASLVAERVLDELLLTVSPLLAGGTLALTALAGEAEPEPVRMSLVTALEHEGELLLRYRLAV